MSKAELVLGIQKDHGWCFGMEFFIQAALFEKTGYADWELKLSRGPRDNYTDGEVDYMVHARRLCAYGSEGFGKKSYHQYTAFPVFRVNASGYSWRSVLDDARRELAELEPKDQEKVYE